MANFSHGFLLHERNSSEKDIEEAIHYYKEASSFNIQYAKNNLGIIHKRGYYQVKNHIGSSIDYFEEAIRQKNDYLSMYNLVHIYMYNDNIKHDSNKLIQLLIQSSRYFRPSFDLLCLLVVKEFGFDIETIKEEIKKQTDETSDLSTRVVQSISAVNFLINQNMIIFMNHIVIKTFYMTSILNQSYHLILDRRKKFVFSQNIRMRRTFHLNFTMDSVMISLTLSEHMLIYVNI